MPETVGCFALVLPQRPVVFAQRDVVLLAVDVTGQVFGRPAQLDQDLLDMTALTRMDDDGVRVDAGADERLHTLGAQHFLEHRSVDAAQHQPVRWVVLET